MKIEFSINETKYTISGLTIYDHYHIQNETLLNPHASVAIVSYLSGCDEALLRQLEVEEWNGLWTVVQEFINEALNPKVGVTKQMKFNGTKYGLVNMDTMSIGEFADLDILVSTPGADRRLHEVVAILYRPIVNGEPEPYDTASSKLRAEEFKLLPVSEAMKALAFFLSFGLQSLSNIVDYLQQIQETTQMTPEQSEIVQMTRKQLQEVGTKLSSSSPTTTSWSWTEWQAWELKLASIGLRISKTESGNKNSHYKKLVKNISLN